MLHRLFFMFLLLEVTFIPYIWDRNASKVAEVSTLSLTDK